MKTKYQGMPILHVIGIIGIGVSVNQVLGDGTLTERLFALAFFFMSIMILLQREH